MPDPVPAELRPLPFDTAAAERAMAACRRAAVRIEAARVTRSACASWARVEWRGPARAELDADLTRIDAAGSDLRARLLSLAGTIATARDDVAGRNRARADARARWLADQPD